MPPWGWYLWACVEISCINSHATCLFVCPCQTTSLSSSCPCQRTGLRSTSWWLRLCPIRERESRLTKMALCCLFVVLFPHLASVCAGGSVWSHNVPKPWRPNLTTTHLQLRLSESTSALTHVIITVFCPTVSNVIVSNFSVLSGRPLRSSTVGWPGRAKTPTGHQVEVSARETAVCVEQMFQQCRVEELIDYYLLAAVSVVYKLFIP